MYKKSCRFHGSFFVLIFLHFSGHILLFVSQDKRKEAVELRKKWKKLCFILLLCIFFCGCNKLPAQVPQTVTRVDIYGTHNHHKIRRHYTQPEKMAGILNYLRLLGFNGGTDLDPSVLPGDDFQIHLGFSDGLHKEYRIHANRYLCHPNGVWEKVDKDVAKQLAPYLYKTSSDL